MGEKDAEWEISLGRRRPSRHESNDRITNRLDRLLKVVVKVPHMAADGEPRVLKTHLIDFVDLSADESNPRATVRFGVPKKTATNSCRVESVGTRRFVRESWPVSAVDVLNRNG
jgi:hypothetical protein